MAGLAAMMPSSLTGGAQAQTNPAQTLGRYEAIARALSKEEKAAGALTTEGIERVVKEVGGSTAEARRAGGAASGAERREGLRSSAAAVRSDDRPKHDSACWLSRRGCPAGEGRP